MIEDDPQPKTGDAASLGSLFAKLSEQSSTLFRNEVELAKAEAKEKVVRSGVSIGMFLVGAAIAYFALAVLIAAAVLGMANAFSPWLAALLVALILLLLAGALVVGGVFILKRRSKSPKLGVRVKQDLQAFGIGKDEEQTHD